MTKQEFLDFCHEEFTKRGFTKKRKNMYYLQGKDFLCGLYLQKSMAEAYYINCAYFFDKLSGTKYPTIYENDWYRRLVVLSKDTINGEHFMDAMWCYEEYTKEEMLPYLEKEFDEIMNYTGDEK
mgnify:CR=1 FL=1